MDFNSANFPLRPAWTEIDLGRLRRNLLLIRRDLPANVKLLAIAKLHETAGERYGRAAGELGQVPGQPQAQRLNRSMWSVQFANPVISSQSIAQCLR